MEKIQKNPDKKRLYKKLNIDPTTKIENLIKMLENNLNFSLKNPGSKLNPLNNINNLFMLLSLEGKRFLPEKYFKQFEIIKSHYPNPKKIS